MGQRRRVDQLVSSGGVVCRVTDDKPEVVICGRGTPIIWGLPKGTPNPGETSEEVALREVREETGLEVALEGFIDSISYWFVRSADSVRCHKTVHFYLMSPRGGSLSKHDLEFDIVRWSPAGEVLNSLTYPNEARVVEKALSMVMEKETGGRNRDADPG